jgi:hypothetical protein
MCNQCLERQPLTSVPRVDEAMSRGQSELVRCGAYMRILIALILLVSFSVAQAEWVLFGSDDRGSVYYIDYSRIQSISMGL